jgi:sRNA-binding carbon storage regulator CsrA
LIRSVNRKEFAMQKAVRRTALVVGREDGESVSIGNDITVTPFACSPGRVRLRIVAPPDMQIVRDDAIRRTPRPRPTAKTPAA